MYSCLVLFHKEKNLPVIGVLLKAVANSRRAITLNRQYKERKCDSSTLTTWGMWLIHRSIWESIKTKKRKTNPSYERNRPSGPIPPAISANSTTEWVRAGGNRQGRPDHWTGGLPEVIGGRRRDGAAAAVSLVTSITDYLVRGCGKQRADEKGMYRRPGGGMRLRVCFASLFDLIKPSAPKHDLIKPFDSSRIWSG